MTRSTSQFICQQCGYSQVGWAGRCPECQSWGSLVETIISTKSSSGRTSSKSTTRKTPEPVSLASISAKKIARISSKITELDRVLGGGLVTGQVVLIAGEPGIGKSTLLLQLADKLGNFLYVSGEESAGQIAVRAARLGIVNKTIQLFEETDIDSVIETTNGSGDKLTCIVVDSIQTMTTSDLSGMAGSVGQVRECAYRLVRLAKSNAIPIFIVGHVTKQGSVAGPSVLMHIVDTVLWFEGDKTLSIRLLRAVKNRFGPTDEVGIFSMANNGLNAIDSPEKMFLTNSRKAVSGSVITAILQGTRTVMVEIQALVVPTKMAFPKRIAQGYDAKRFELMLAVLTRRCGLPLNDFDCFLNVSGGISIKGDPSADLAVCLAVTSSYFDKALPNKTISFGEVGLLGDVREVVLQDKRLKEAKRLGFINCIASNKITYLQEGIKQFFR